MAIIDIQYPDGSRAAVGESLKLQVQHPSWGSYVPSSLFVYDQDHFTGDVIGDQWSAAKGSDAQAVIAAVVAGAHGGVVSQTTGDSVVVAESCVSLTKALNYKSANTIRFECRFKPVTSVANVQYFIGLTDVLATTTLEQPITLSGTTLTTAATDAVGFVYDTDATNDTWHLQGVKADTDTALLNSTIVPVVDTWAVYRIEVSSTGTASFYINDVLVGEVANAVTTTVALTPVVEAMARTTTVKEVQIDYIDVFTKVA